MNKVLLASFVLLTLAACTPPMPDFACDDEGPKSPLCPGDQQGDETLPEFACDDEGQKSPLCEADEG